MAGKNTRDATPPRGLIDAEGSVPYDSGAPRKEEKRPNRGPSPLHQRVTRAHTPLPGRNREERPQVPRPPLPRRSSARRRWRALAFCGHGVRACCPDYSSRPPRRGHGRPAVVALEAAIQTAVLLAARRKPGVAASTRAAWRRQGLTRRYKACVQPTVQTPCSKALRPRACSWASSSCSEATPNHKRTVRRFRRQRLSHQGGSLRRPHHRRRGPVSAAARRRVSTCRQTRRASFLSSTSSASSSNSSPIKFGGPRRAASATPPRIFRRSRVVAVVEPQVVRR